MLCSVFDRRWIGVISACCLIAASAVPVSAQEEGDEGVVESVEMTVLASDDGSPPVIFQSTGGSAPMMFSSSLAGLPAGVNGDFVMPAPDPWSMINNPSVQKDLELVGDQLDKVRDLQKRQGEEMKEQLGMMQKGGSFDLGNVEEFKSNMQRMREQHQSELQKLLLPHQVDRLHQIALQTHMRSAGTAGALSNSKVAEALDLSDDQVKQLKDKSKQLNEDLQKKIEQLKQEMKKELLGVLNAEQREKLQEMTGEDYKPNSEDWKERFRQRVRQRPNSRERD